jgi:hypothetical protein
MTLTMRLIIAALGIFLALACSLHAGPGYQVVEVDQPAPEGGGSGPTVSSYAIDKSGTELTVVFSESVTVGSGGGAGVVLTLSSGTTTATYLRGSGSDTLVYSLWNPVLPSVTGTVAYTQPGDGLEATTGGDDVSSFSGDAIDANASTVVIFVDFEGDGYNTQPAGSWTEETATDGTVDEDYASSPLAGSQSLFLDEGTGGDVSTYIDLGTGYPDLAARVMHRIVTKPGANLTNTTTFGFADSGGTSRASAKFNYTDATDAAALVAAIATTNGTPASSTFTGQTAVYLWLDYSNTSDVVNAYVSTALTRPPADGVLHSSSTASQSAAIQRVRFVEPHVTKQTAFDNLVVWVP